MYTCIYIYPPPHFSTGCVQLLLLASFFYASPCCRLLPLALACSCWNLSAIRIPTSRETAAGVPFGAQRDTTVTPNSPTWHPGHCSHDLWITRQHCIRSGNYYVGVTFWRCQVAFFQEFALERQWWTPGPPKNSRESSFRDSWWKCLRKCTVCRRREGKSKNPVFSSWLSFGIPWAAPSHHHWTQGRKMLPKHKKNLVRVLKTPSKMDGFVIDFW